MKQTMRRLAGWRGLGDYQYTERYRAADLVKSLFATSCTVLPRPTYLSNADDPATAYHPHKGFNWRAFRRTLGERCVIQRTRFSPFGWSRGLASSQAWFVCRPRG
jgi:hypothetical protein